MTEKQKREIIASLQSIYDNFVPNNDESDVNYEPGLSMFGLISRYNSTGQNEELIGGDWVINNCPEPLKILP